MKRTCLFGFLLLMAMMAWTQTTRTITLDYSEKDFTFHTNKGLTFISSNVYNLTYSSDTSSPALPYISVKILIGPNESVTGYDVRYTERFIHKDIGLCRNLPCYSTSESVNVNPFWEMEYKNDSYPNNLVQFNGVHSSAGYRYADFIVSPFSYKPRQKALFLNAICITLSIKKRVCDLALKCFDNHLIKKMVANPDDITTLYPNSNSTGTRAYLSSRRDSVAVDYIILTCDSLKDIFQELANWKIQKGINTKVITVEDVYGQENTNEPNHIRIKRSLGGYYNNGDGCRFILLGGDFDVIPAPLCYVQYGTLHRFSITDLYYSCFHAPANVTNEVVMTWDGDQDGIMGEIEDSMDLTPSVSIARLPVRNRSNAYTIVNRIINYEKGSNITNWKNNVLMFGAGDANNFFIGLPEQSQSQYFCDTLYSTVLSNLCWDRFRFYDTDSDYPTGQNYELTAINIQAEMEKGYHFIYGDTHGWPDRWILENSNYNVQDGKSFNNPISSHFVTTACWTNKFDDNECLSKSFLWNPNGGLLSYFGSSVEGWFSPFGGVIGSELIMHLYFRELSSNNSGLAINYRRLGEVVRRVKEDIIAYQNVYTYADTYRWLLYSMNILGDPEMPVFISTPQKQNDITCTFSNGVLTINSSYNPGSLAEICIMSLNDNGATYYYRSSFAYNPTFLLPEGEYSVCITHPGSIPYVKYIGETVHIQNKTIYGEMRVEADDVYIGEDVLSNTPQGPVSIINGKTEVKITGGATIKNGFEVRKGAVFSIEPINN